VNAWTCGCGGCSDCLGDVFATAAEEDMEADELRQREEDEEARLEREVDDWLDKHRD